MSNILLNQPANRQGIVGVLLAAGSSSRFGTPKLLHPLDDGTRLGVKSALNLIEALPWAVAVVSPQRPLLKSLLEAAGLQVLTCAAAELGMGESLAYAIRHTPHAAGWVVALADMPFIQPNTIKQVMRRLAGGSALAVPTYDGRRGHPVGFASHYYNQLAELSGDAGARAIIERDASAAQLVPVRDPGVLIDIDTLDDLARHDASGALMRRGVWKPDRNPRLHSGGYAR
ncbi:nucleotidyltransferase family protein [Silvimonas sp. JCM 19000]